MTGKYEVIVNSRRLQYKFTICRNITLLRGDSATGKTTLIEMINAYNLNGPGIGITVSCQKPCTVLTGLRWKENLASIHDSIVFIDEGDRFTLSEEFASAIKDTDNYYVIATRSSLFNLPYSINEIYGIRNVAGNKYQGTKRLYAEFYPLCRVGESEFRMPDLVVVEDSNSGYQFFNDYFSRYNIKCISAGGKSNIYGELLNNDYSVALVIADGAAFGPEIERVLSLKKARDIILYLPESFEWIVLKSGLIKNNSVSDVMRNPHEYIESRDYFSWERFFTDLLIESTKDSYLKYEKSTLNDSYLNERERNAIADVMPDIIEK